MNNPANHLSEAASTISYIGIGSNLKQPVQQVLKAINSLAKLPNSRLLAQSSLYRSYALKVPVDQAKPLEAEPLTSSNAETQNACEPPAAQNDYINAVAKLETRLAAQQLLLELQAIERQHGRIRKQRWEPRPLDLDILLYGDQTIATETLRVPHPEMSKRHFVLYPLAEIAPQLIMPCNTQLADLLKRCPLDELAPLDSAEVKLAKTELAKTEHSQTAPSAGE